jgi:hypothetical protein
VVLAKVMTRIHGSRSNGFGRALKYILRADGKSTLSEIGSGDSGHINMTHELYWSSAEHQAAYAEDVAAIFDSSARQCQGRGRFWGNPVYHLAITWQEGEHPTPRQAEHSCEHVMKALGFEECPAVWALHRDTDNDHLHLVVNRVHPKKLTAVSVPYRDYLILDRSMRELELELGFARSNGPYVTVDTPEGPKIVRMNRRERSVRGLLLDPEAPRLTRGAQRAEHELGGTSFQTWITQGPAKALRQALEAPGSTWEDLHRVLARFNCQILPKGSGLVIATTLSSDRVLAAKASSLGRFAGKSALEKTLGPYAVPEALVLEPSEGRRETYESFVVRERLDVTRDGPGDAERMARRAERSEARRRLVERFSLEQVQIRAKREVERSALRQRHAKERDTLFVRHRDERRTHRQADALRQKPIALALWAFKAATEREALQRRHAEERRRLTAQLPPGEAWRLWLERQAQAGDEATISALRGIRYREKRRQRIEDGFQGERSVQGPFAVGALRAEVDAKRQIVIYRWADGTEVFSDQGEKLVMKDKADVSLEAALRVAAQKYAGRIEITGSETFRERAARMATLLGITVLDKDLQITVDDERHRAWGRREPSRLESSPSRGEDRQPGSKPALER